MRQKVAPLPEAGHELASLLPRVTGAGIAGGLLQLLFGQSGLYVLTQVPRKHFRRLANSSTARSASPMTSGKSFNLSEPRGKRNVKGTFLIGVQLWEAKGGLLPVPYL